MSAARAKMAQVGGGNEKVVAHPSYRDLPVCLFPITNTEALDRYNVLAMQLFERGRLTTKAHTSLSTYIVQFGAINDAARKGRPIRASSVQQMNKALQELDLDGDTQPIAAPETAPVNKFARNGFSRIVR